MWAILTWSGKSQTLLAIETAFVRALPPVLLAAIATGAGAWLGARAASLVVQGHLADMAALTAAIICAGVCYGAVVLMFRSRLPLGRLAR